MGLFIFHTGIRKHVLDTNLRIAFGESLCGKELRDLRKRTCINAATILFEFLAMKNIKLENLGNYISIEGIEHLEYALDEKKGVVVAGSHFGNWELAAAALSHFGDPLHVFTGMQKNKRIDEAINQIRRRFGTVTISKAKTAPFEMMKALRNNKPLGMAGDLNVPHNNLFVDFFGKKAVVGQGLATYTLKRKVPLLFFWNVRIAPFKYKGYVKRLYYQDTGNAELDLLGIAQMISIELEEKIRQHPEQYFWFNRRWKTRPPDDPDDVY
jgi:Kdo2-lipid IVA lauroyltransferase/acyltransferase